MPIPIPGPAASKPRYRHVEAGGLNRVDLPPMCHVEAVAGAAVSGAKQELTRNRRVLTKP